MLTVTVDGVPLHYHDVGQGLPVLLLHAFPLNGAAFDAQVAALSGRYRFIIPDHRGFGQSKLGEGPTEMAPHRPGRAGAAGRAEDRLGGGGRRVHGRLRGHGAAARGRGPRARAGAGGHAGHGGRRGGPGPARGLGARRPWSKGVEPLVQTLLPKLVAAGPDSPVGREVAAMMRSRRSRGHRRRRSEAWRCGRTARTSSRATRARR